MSKRLSATCRGALALLTLLFAAAIPAREPTPPTGGPRYEDAQVSIRIVLRTPDQLAAFYIGRQFNQASIDRILQTCFVTPVIHNKSVDVLWLELDAWEFRRGAQRIPRIKRDYWPDRWTETGLSQAHQSTFGWTLMPEVRDLRIDEGVGGSVVIPWQEQPFTLVMNFPTGMDKQGPVKSVVFEDLECKSDPS
jgi:hypothetical protein